MASFNKFNIFVQDVAHKEHDLETDQLVVALSNSAPAATNTVLADITEISYACSSRNITTGSSLQTSGTYKLVLEDLTLTATDTCGPFQYVIVYNDTSTSDKLIAYHDNGSAITLQAGDQFVLNFDSLSGILTLV